MSLSVRKLRDYIFLVMSIICAFLLMLRLTYMYLSNASNFPLSTFKIVANYQHIRREQIEDILKNYEQDGFFSLHLYQLNANIRQLSWVKSVQVEHVWPDILKIKIVEKKPYALWNHRLMAKNGELLENEPSDWQSESNASLPKLSGPPDLQLDVLHMYEKLSKLLLAYGISANSLILRDNQSWDLSLSNGVVLRLGKQDIEQRILRFCQAYSVVFADRIDDLSGVDLRYVHGMAAQWKETNKKAG